MSDKTASTSEPTALRCQIAQIWAEVIGCELPTGNVTFFELGGTSLQLVRAQKRLSQCLGFQVDVTTLLETPRLHDLARSLAALISQQPMATGGSLGDPSDVPEEVAGKTLSDDAIAIIGMAGRFPGAASMDAFWESICEGRNLIRRFDHAELEDSFTDAERTSENYVPVRPFLDDADKFDAKFFGILPREAAVMDPQHRVFLELCYEALERGGHNPLETRGRVGVFAGQSANTYALHNIFAERTRVEDFTSNFQVGNYAELTGSWVDSLATRVSFKLNLKGPALTVQTACSTSLTAIAQACESLRSGASDMALAGGVSITFPQRRGYMAMEGGMVSGDGICRPFDADANGTVFGHGAGVVLLKPLQAALRDEDPVIAVIRGVGMNNDGSDKIAYTAPSVNGQAGAIRAALEDAAIEPSSIGYIECHGTATPLGDPVELTGLAQVFGEHSDAGSIAIGSVKGNIGHLDAAAGVMSVIKTALMLRNATIPPVANLRAPNPNFDFNASPFRIAKELSPWPDSDAPRRAGVSSFGVGGTNVHVILEEAPLFPEVQASERPVILPLAAKTPEALAQMRADLAAFIEAEAPSLPDLALTVQAGRPAFPLRSAVACTRAAEAITALRKPLGKLTPAPEDAPPVVFMFPGQGSQYPGMGSGLYASEPVFRKCIDRGAAVLEPLLGIDINQLLCFGDVCDAEAARTLRDTRLTQPALYLAQVATAQVWMARGVRPSAMIGHSVGEFAAATLAGVMEFEAGLRIIAARGRLMQDQPEGAMLSVRASADDIAPLIDDSVEIAARNAPKLCVLAGPQEAIDEMAAKFQAQDIPCAPLHTSHAFHSRMIDPVIQPLMAEIHKHELRAPEIPYVSCVSGDWITPEQACDPDYWARQARETVAFETGLRTLAGEDKPVFLEVGAGRTLAAFAGQTLARDSHAGIFTSLPDHQREVADEVALCAAAGGLWSAGVSLDWRLWRRGESRRIAAPSYPFERQRHWVDPPPSVRRAVTRPAAESPHSLADTGPIMPQRTPQENRKQRLATELCALLSELSGEEIGTGETGASFLELGFDSLFLGQVSQRVNRDYKLQISFRQLLSDFPTINALAAHLDQSLPAEPAPAPAPVQPQAQTAQITAPVPKQLTAAPSGAATGMESVIQQQLQAMQTLFSEQLHALSGGSTVGAAHVTSPAPALAGSAPAPGTAAHEPTSATKEPPRYTIGRGMSGGTAELTSEQLAFARDLAERYAQKHAGSKALTARYRDALADPRTATGFRDEWKEMVFPIVAQRSKGARIWDVDGNEFLDIVSGFGQTAFGHSPDFMIEAVQAQMERGFAIGPQADLAGSVAAHFAAFTGHERVTFCNTGSEAVMAAMRVARSVTGRDRVVVFSNDYHGQFDEVLVKGSARSGATAALPIAPGIPRSALGNMSVLPYGAPESLDWIRANLDEIAAIMIEPVQSRHPEHRPVEFVRELRALADQGGAALVFDEVVTGFRVHKRGMQGVWGIRADMATYGKIVGGGMPIGVLAGDARFMNALDGGPWNYGDASRPECPPTFFAGTFVRHPLVLAAVDATLKHMEAQGDDLWTRTAQRTEALVAGYDAMFDRRGLPRLISGYSSWFTFNLVQYTPSAALFYPLLRLAGVHVQEGYNGYMTTAHSDADFARIGELIEDAVDQLQSVGILAGERTRPAAARPTQTQAALPQRVPLTHEQQEIWMTEQMGDLASTSFNEGTLLRLRGRLDREALSRSLDALIARHDALRLVFARDGSSFDVTAPFALDLPLHDVSDASDPNAALEEIADAEARLPFDLVNGPVIRAHLVRLAEENHCLILNAHHIICDGWSYNVLLEEMGAIYSALVRGHAPDLPAAPSFAAHALACAQAAPSDKVEAYWRQQFVSIPELPELPVDRPRGGRRSFNGATYSTHLDKARLKAFRTAGAKQGCTLFATLFAGLHLMLGKLSGANDLVIGVPTGGQALLESPELVGHCVKFLPIRASFAPDAPASQHLAHIRDQVLAAFDHQDTTYGALVQSLNIDRSINRLPLTEVQFNLEKLADGLRMDGLEVTAAPNRKTAVNFDLFFNVIESRDGLRFDVDYNPDLFDEATVARWIAHLDTLLQAIAEDSETCVQDLPLLNRQEARALETQWNATGADYPAVTLTELLREGAARHGDAPALEAQDGRLTHAELDAQSDAMAAKVQRLLPEPGARVAVALDRTCAMVIALMGILKAGHTYVPLDPKQPEERLKLILETAQCAAIIHDGDTAPAFATALGLPGVDSHLDGDLSRPVQHDVSPDAAAYVIFTSGSTGTPKGVEIPHRAVVNFLTSMAKVPGFDASDSILAVTTISFDIAVLEIFLPLITGGRSVLARNEEVIDAFRLVERLEQGDITVLQATPTMWQMLLEAGLKPTTGLKMLIGGEPLPADLAQQLTAVGAELWNMYGPTETTIWSAAHRIEPDAQRITIGYPIANTSLHVLSEADKLVPVGVIGELNIGGDGLALGYFGRPDLTKAAFRDVALSGGVEKLYKTGDLARRLADGTIEVLGRSDSQIKLRGFRIELGDVEAALRGLAEVDKAAVALRKGHDGLPQLVAYVVPSAGAEPTPAGLMRALQEKLPAYMVPGAWVMMEKLPQTLNGKLDRKALPTPQQQKTTVALVSSVAPQTPLEQRIADIWRDVLGLEDISTHETLFALGADSLKVFRIASRMLADGLDLDARDLLQHPTIRALAAHAAERSVETRAKPVRPSLKDFRRGARRVSS
ncbi:MAG: amino acid adenylation domain-containing protein [Rhodobacteraceae bacterium]|nr:MAG: amino acid adenylation domain-containing protein [Paracoccaceae bacterium]